MGAVIALRELLEFSRGADYAEAYGPETGPALRDLMEQGAKWRMGAETENEIRALLEFASENSLPLVIDGASGAADIADEIAAAGVVTGVMKEMLAC